MNVFSADTTTIDRDDELIVVIGRRGHPEIRKMVEVRNESAIVSRVDDVCRWDCGRLRIVRHRQVSDRLFHEIMTHIQLMNQLAELRFIDSDPNCRRQCRPSVDELLMHVDAVVVVRGRRFRTGRASVKRCHQRGVPAVQVRGVTDLDPEWFADCRTVGVIVEAGAPMETVQQVRAALEQMDPQPCRSSSGRP